MVKINSVVPGGVPTLANASREGTKHTTLDYKGKREVTLFPSRGDKVKLHIVEQRPGHPRSHKKIQPIALDEWLPCLLPSLPPRGTSIYQYLWT